MKKRFTLEDLRSKGLVEVRPGVFNKPSLHSPVRGEYTFHIEPNTKPRMTQRDKWLSPPRKPVRQYLSFKTELLRQAFSCNLPDLPMIIGSIEFVVPVPVSLPKKERQSRYGQLHTHKPDIDNYLKALFDCLCKNDQHIAKINGPLSKRWENENEGGKIIITL